MKKELKVPDRVTQKMTRDGAVTENLATGEVTNISRREAETELSGEGETSSAVDLAERAADAHERRSMKKEARAGRETVKRGSEVRRRPSSRLQFTDEERADPALEKYIRRSDRAARIGDPAKSRDFVGRGGAAERVSFSPLGGNERYGACDDEDAAKEAIPTKKVLTKERTFDGAAGRGKTRLRFEDVEKKPNGSLRHNPLARPVQEVKAAAHGEIRRVEQENVGVEAGHRGEELSERGVSYAGRKARAGIRRHRMKPWRDAEKAEQELIRANADFLYQKALHDDPALASSNPVSRYLQKKRIQKNYAKQVRQAQKTAKTTEAAVSSAAKRVKEAARETAAFVKRHWKVVLPVVGIGAIVALLFGGMSSCSVLGGSGVGGVFTSSYLSEDADMLAAEAAYCGMEAELQAELDNYEALHPGYDEYRYDLDDIEHDPYVLTSILSALHEGTFTVDEVQGDLEMLFEKQYILTEATETATRYRTETRTGTREVTDPETGETTTEEYEYEVEVPYTYYIRNVKLENFNLSHVPVYIMGEDTLSMYATYMATLGNREDLFPGSSYVGKYTAPPTAYEIPPSALEDETFAALITEAEKYVGYPYVWGGSSPSTSFDCSGFVSWALTNSGVCNTGRLGAQGLYNISTPVSSANARPGDLIFFVGTYDTPGVSHVGIYVGGGMMLHCGDPIQYSNINTSYWQEHFYAFARPPYN